MNGSKQECERGVIMSIELLRNQEWFEVEPEAIRKNDIFRYGGQNYLYRADEDDYVNGMGTVKFSFSVISEEELKNV